MALPRPLDAGAAPCPHHQDIDPLSGCHIWQRSTKPNGYGQLTYRCQRWMTHRLAWIARHGPIPKSLEGQVALATECFVLLIIS